MKAPHEFLSMLNQCETMINLTINVEEQDLQLFLSNDANLYLIDYFAKQSGQVDDSIQRAIDIICEMSSPTDQ